MATKTHPVSGEIATTNTLPLCPICGRVITETQRLEVRTAPGRNYWVTWHRFKGDIQPDGKPRDPAQQPIYTEYGDAWYPWCGEADIQTVVPK